MKHDSASRVLQGAHLASPEGVPPLSCVGIKRRGVPPRETTHRVALSKTKDARPGTIALLGPFMSPGRVKVREHLTVHKLPASTLRSYWRSCDRLRRGSTDSRSLPAASRAAPTEGSKTKQGRNIQSRGEGQGGHTQTIFLQLHRERDKLSSHLQARTHLELQAVIYANEEETGFIHMAANTISCSV